MLLYIAVIGFTITEVSFQKQGERERRGGREKNNK